MILDKFSMKIVVVVCLLLLASPLVAMAQTTGGTQIGVREHLDSVMTNQTKETLFVSVDKLHSLLTDGNESNDPFIIDIRSLEHYKSGHIDGAIHTSLFAIAKEENLEKVPKNKTVVVYCYTGQTGAMATVALKSLGYENARNMKFGMQAWTKNDTVNPMRYDLATDGRDYSFVTGVETVAGGLPVDEINVSDLREHIDSVMANQTKKTLFTTVDSLNELLTDGNESNDPFIIDIRSLEHYKSGHIDGAIHTSLFAIAKEENLEKVPKNKTVVVYCYTGQTGAMATVALKSLGYENARNMKFGMQAWTKNDTVNPMRYNPETDGKDYEFVAVTPTSPTPVPTLTPPGIAILIGIMLVTGFRVLRRRK